MTSGSSSPRHRGARAAITHDDDPTALALNVLEDRFSSSAAIAGSELFLRGERYLYSIAEEGEIDERTPSKQPHNSGAVPRVLPRR